MSGVLIRIEIWTHQIEGGRVMTKEETRVMTSQRKPRTAGNQKQLDMTIAFKESSSLSTL